MCSTLETRSQRASSSASTAVYMSTTPSSPQFFQDATISPSMEKSGWYDDEDEESKWWKLRLRTRGNSSIDGGGPPRTKKKLSLGKTFLNNAKEALMEVFRSEEWVVYFVVRVFKTGFLNEEMGTLVDLWLMIVMVCMKFEGDFWNEHLT
jgi:hypothetical protein